MNLDAWMRHLAVHDLLGNEETSLVTGKKGDYACTPARPSADSRSSL
ncbi:MAG: hypothetical protein CM1200mP29_07260 [Verrucomicrobiota bacterium]|nr:MAG: hypothetical protein CM1200mP29_07260 [Verrucomicrobiota bacterium]